MSVIPEGFCLFVLHVCACTRARVYVLREIQTSTTVGITLSKRLDENNRHNLYCLKYRYSFVLYLRNRKKMQCQTTVPALVSNQLTAASMVLAES